MSNDTKKYAVHMMWNDVYLLDTVAAIFVLLLKCTHTYKSKNVHNSVALAVILLCALACVYNICSSDSVVLQECTFCVNTKTGA